MLSYSRIPSVVLTAAIAGQVSADDIVVPNAYTATQASTSGLNTFIRDVGNARTGQLLVGGSQLGAIPVGSQITGLSFRMYAGNLTGFPATTATWADYTINVGVGVSLGTQTTTFATNFTSAPTTVRTGPLVVPAGSYSGGSSPSPNPFGPTITFSTPYVYTGGNLLVEIRHTGSDITNTTTDFLEVATTAAPGYGTDFWSATATGAAATTGAQGNFTITRFEFTPVPEPATVLGLGLVGLGLFRFARRAHPKRGL